MTRTERALMLRVTRLEAQLRRYQRSADFIDEWCDTHGTWMLDQLERLQCSFGLILGTSMTTGRDLEVAKIEHDLGLPPVEKGGE